MTFEANRGGLEIMVEVSERDLAQKIGIRPARVGWEIVTVAGEGTVQRAVIGRPELPGFGRDVTAEAAATSLRFDA
jgi:hypothetical protein